MGASSPTGTVQVRTDKGVYYAGETVTGTIYVWLPANYSGNTLVLKVKGKEQTDFYVDVPDNNPHHQPHQQQQMHDPNNPFNNNQNAHHNQPRTRRVYHHGRNMFYNHRIPVYIWNTGFIPAGQYSFPFAFALNNFLPGTFQLDHPDFKGVIQYRLKAELETWNKKEKPLKNSCPMVIREPLKTQVTQLHGEMNATLSTWCCVSKGTSFIRCYFERNAYAPGEVANIICEVDNSHCDLAIQRLRCSLKSKITFRDNQGEVLEKNENVLTQDFEGVGAHQSALGEAKRCYSIMLVNQSTKTPFMPSTNGQLIKCHFTLEVLADVEGCTCCSSLPRVEVPVTIFAPVAQMQTLAPPPDWHPQAMPTMNIVLSDAYSYNSKQQGGGGMAISTGGGMGGMGNIQVSTTGGAGPGGMAHVQMNIGVDPTQQGFGGGAYVNMDKAQPNFAPQHGQ